MAPRRRMHFLVYTLLPLPPSSLLAPLFEVEPIAKAVRKVEEEARCTPRVANGVVEPTPSEPPTLALFETVSAEVEALVRTAR